MSFHVFSSSLLPKFETDIMRANTERASCSTTIRLTVWHAGRKQRSNFDSKCWSPPWFVKCLHESQRETGWQTNVQRFCVGTKTQMSKLLLQGNLSVLKKIINNKLLTLTQQDPVNVKTNTNDWNLHGIVRQANFVPWRLPSAAKAVSYKIPYSYRERWILLYC